MQCGKSSDVGQGVIQTAPKQRDRDVIAPGFGMREEVGLLCNGKSGDLELEKKTARMLRDIFELWKERRLLCGDSLMAFVVPVGQLGPTSSQWLSQTSTSPTKTNGL